MMRLRAGCIQGRTWRFTIGFYGRKWAKRDEYCRPLVFVLAGKRLPEFAGTTSDRAKGCAFTL